MLYYVKIDSLLQKFKYIGVIFLVKFLQFLRVNVWLNLAQLID
jgi:hypothetical protein